MRDDESGTLAAQLASRHKHRAVLRVPDGRLPRGDQLSLGGFGSGFGVGRLPVAVIVARIMEPLGPRDIIGTPRSWHATAMRTTKRN